jgi:NitT/TauT family transport system substrate-binding protein
VRTIRFALITAIVFVLSACAAGKTIIPENTVTGGVAVAPLATNTIIPTEQPLTKISLPVGYIPNVQFAPLYVGIEKGFYREAGLEVSIDYSMENDNAVLLATGNLQFAILSGEQVLLGRAQGLPLVYTMAWYQQYPVGIIAKTSAGINNVADLKGKKIGLPGLFGASYIGAMALLYSGGLTDKDVTLDSIGFNQVEMLLADREDAVVVYIANEPAQLESMGENISVLKVSDAVQMVGNGLVTDEKTVQENPELVRAMTMATLKAIQYTIDHPDEAYEISKAYVPNLATADQVVQKQVLLNSIELWKGGKPGFSEPQAWENMQTVMKTMGLLTSDVDVSACFTNEFISK